jgi:hypothetical protein
MAMPSRSRASASIEQAENGFVVNTTGHGKEGYHDKTHIAPSGHAAMRIATGHLRGLASGKSKKKGGKRKASKRAA